MTEQFNYQNMTEQVGQNPYVVSADIGILLNRWGQQKKFQIPDQSFLNSIRADFSREMSGMFPAFELVPEQELTEGLSQIVDESEGVPISLDGVYYPNAMRLEMSRNIGGNLQDKGLFRRADTDMLAIQFRNIKRAGIDTVQLIDDVLFTGDMIFRIDSILQKMGISVTGVNVGIAIGEGIAKLAEVGIPVRAVRTYDQVTDEICERDFYPGVSYGGRSLVDDAKTGVPYLLPFGNPAKWASIPEARQKEFSRFCINQTTRLYEEIEKINARVVTTEDLDRKVLGIPENTSFVEALKSLEV